MIAQATHTATQSSHSTTASHTADPRTKAKARMRAAAAKPKPAPAPTPSERLKNFDHTTVIDFVRRHPLATAAGVGAAATMIGPVRLVRVGMAAFRTVSLAAGVVTFLGSLGVPEAEQAVEAAMPHSKTNTQRKRATAKRNTPARSAAKRSTRPRATRSKSKAS